MEKNERDFLFNQDATTRTANRTAFLQDLFDYCIVGRGLCPPRYPDLRPPDLFLCGFLTERVYSLKSRSLKYLKTKLSCNSGIPVVFEIQ
jgi:hypothetical protein